MLVTSYLNGASAGVSGGHIRTPGKRDRVKGWSTSAVRRHTRWLYSIDAPLLGGQGYAATLTVRDCPESADAWHTLRRSFIKRLERAGLLRYHWVTEWQRRGVPHLHGAFYFPESMTYPEVFQVILTAWLEASASLGSRAGSQDVKRIDGAVGWLQYLSKHASRGVRHYQRQGKPDGWESTGRLWGYGGEWPATDPMKFELERHAGYRFRRLVRAWTIADARRSGDPKRIAWARQMLRCNDVHLSHVRGVSGWIPESTSLALIGLLIDQGEGVTQRD